MKKEEVQEIFVPVKWIDDALDELDGEELKNVFEAMRSKDKYFMSDKAKCAYKDLKSISDLTEGFREWQVDTRVKERLKDVREFINSLLSQ